MQGTARARRRTKSAFSFKKLAIVLALLLLVITFLPVVRFQKLENENPLPPAFSKGVFHVHSTFSDGKGDVEEISSVADALGLDFVVLTDHGTTNRGSASATQWLNGVLLVGGSEFFLEGAHMAAAGFSTPTYRYPPEPQEAIHEVNREVGVSFISHPFFYAYPWTDWDVEGHTGIELINGHTFASHFKPATLFLFPRYVVRPSFAMLTTLEYPHENVAEWEKMNRSGRHSGIFALDAHARLLVGFGRYVNLPTYSQAFSLLNVYLKRDRALTANAETDAAVLVASMRAGSFFNCIEAIAPANGFDTVFVSDTGESLEMGGVSPLHAGRLLISVPFDFPTDVVVLRNAEVFREFTHNKEEKLAVRISDGGVYRVEVYARASAFDQLPWIVGNPFFLDTVRAPEVSPIPVAGEVLSPGPGFFRMECDPSSQCSQIEEVDGDGVPVTGIRYALPDEPVTRDYSASLSNRAARSFEGFSGLTLRARSEQRARFWLMFRTENDGGETWYRHSFAADREWSAVAIPFEQFRVHHGEVQPPDLGAVTSIFISIDNQIAYPGASGAIMVEEIGLF